METNPRFNPYQRWDSFVLIPTALLEHGGLSPAAKLMFGLLAKYAGKDGLANPSQARLAKDLGCSSRHVRNIASELEQGGFLERTRATRARTSYHLLLHPALKPSLKHDADQAQNSTDEEGESPPVGGSIVPQDEEPLFQSDEEESFRSHAEGSFPLKESFSLKEKDEKKEEEKTKSIKENTVAADSISWVELLKGDSDLSKYAREALRCGDWNHEPGAIAQAEAKGEGWTLESPLVTELTQNSQEDSTAALGGAAVTYSEEEKAEARAMIETVWVAFEHFHHKKRGEPLDKRNKRHAIRALLELGEAKPRAHEVIKALLLQTDADHIKPSTPTEWIRGRRWTDSLNGAKPSPELQEAMKKAMQDAGIR